MPIESLLPSFPCGGAIGPTGLRCVRAPAFFSEYEYVSDPYSLADELQSEERRQQQRTMQPCPTLDHAVALPSLS